MTTAIDKENKPIDTKEHRGGLGRLGLVRTDGNILYSTGNSMHCGDLSGTGIQKSGDICICIADSLCYVVEANTTL